MSAELQNLGEANLTTAILWGGLIVLTSALIVLIRTNWGQVNPLSKCVVLSVFAHVLILGYAYATKMLLDVPVPLEEKVIRLSMNSRTEVEANTLNEGVAPWDAVATPAEIVPDVETPEQIVPPTEPLEPPEPEPAELPTDPPNEIQQPTPPSTPTANDFAAATPLEEPAALDNLVNQPDLPEQAVETPTDPLVVETPTVAPPAEADPTVTAPAEPNDVTATDPAEPPPVAEVQWPPAPLPLTSQPPNSIPLQPLGPMVAPVRLTHQLIQQLRETAGENADRKIDGAAVPSVYALRNPENRLSFIEQLGGNVRTEQAVEAALAWLAANQGQDGRWDPDQLEAGKEQVVLGHDREGAGSNADTGISALAILAFLGAGQTHLQGDYRRHVQYGLEFLIRAQAANGSLAGDAKFYAQMYCHSMASLAISEAYAMTGDQRLRPFVEQAVKYSVDSQHPVHGGWRYRPGEEGDMSQFGWQVMALSSAELAGVKVPTETRVGMLRFLRKASSGKEGGLAGYKHNAQPSPTMTAEALLCRQLLGMNRDPRTLREAMNFIHAAPPSAKKMNFYYWYYGTLALYQSHSPRWDQWNNQMQRDLLARQRNSGVATGSWDPDSVWGGYGGRVYSTALATLCLEVYYRYLPIYALPNS